VLSFVTLAMLVVGGSGWILYERALESLEAQLSSRLVAEARLIANGLPTGIARFVRPGFEGLFPYYLYHTKWLRESQQMIGASRIYVFDKDCRSLLDTEPGIPIGRQYSIVKYRDRALVDDIWQGQASHTMRFKEPETGVDLMTGYAPMLNKQGEVIAGVGVEIGSGFMNDIHGFKRSVYFFAVLSALLTLILGLGMARQVTRPIKRLVTAAREIGRGNLDQTVETSANDEIGYLSVTMEEMRQKLLARERQLRQMLAGVAHEIRNPLGGIEIYAGLIADDLPEGDERKQHIQKVIGEVRTLNEVIAEFLEFARPVPSDPAMAPVAGLIEDAAFLLNPEMERANIDYRTNVPAGLSVYADGEQIKRALINLMKNAVQAMGEGGQLSVSARNGDGEVAIEVADTGPGVSMDVVERLFEPFFTTREQGSGLGLAIVQQTLEKNGGRVELESVPGKGTSVTIYLPADGDNTMHGPG
jgi:signal transduction histidine kinase